MRRADDLIAEFQKTILGWWAPNLYLGNLRSNRGARTKLRRAGVRPVPECRVSIVQATAETIATMVRARAMADRRLTRRLFIAGPVGTAGGDW
jgi:hypothetical protein